MEQFDLVSLVLSEGDKEHNDVKDKGGKDVGRRWILARAVGGRARVISTERLDGSEEFN